MLKKQLTVALGAALALATVAGLASAHGGDASRVHACVGSGGTVRIVGASEACRANENAVDWAIQGPQGDTGQQGPQGPAGPAGASDAPNRQVVGRLSIAGITGGDADGDGTMELRGYDSGVTNSGTFGGGGGSGAGKASFTDFSVIKVLDAASPVLAMAVARGEHFTSATIEVFKPGTTEVAMSYELKEVIISELHQSATGKAGDIPLESISLNFAEIRWTSFPAGGSPVTRCYSIIRAMAC